MKIGIVTIVDYLNYGNRLQNYALTRMLELEGFEVINGIRVRVKKEWINRSRNTIKRIIKYFIPFCFIKDKLEFNEEPLNELQTKRKEKFILFSKSYTEMIDPIIVSNHLTARRILEKQYGIDRYIAGSDQIWNPYFEGNEYEFLSFAERSKRISFAASIGAEEIPDKMKEFYAEHLKEMKYVSVREEKAALMIKDLIGREVDVALDPTLLLPIKEWNIILKKPDYDIRGDYVCSYFLGDIPETVLKFAETNHLCLYQLNSYNDKELFTLDPAEFLYMINHSKYVLTDSFHGVAFSIKFHKEFYVFRREQKNANNMFSRIESLLNKVYLNNRIQERDFIIEQDVITTWDQIDEYLLSEKEKSIKRLLEQIEI